MQESAPEDLALKRGGAKLVFPGEDGKLHSVRVAATGIVVPTELKYAKGEFTLQ